MLDDIDDDEFKHNMVSEKKSWISLNCSKSCTKITKEPINQSKRRLSGHLMRVDVHGEVSEFGYNAIDVASMDVDIYKGVMQVTEEEEPAEHADGDLGIATHTRSFRKMKLRDLHSVDDNIATDIGDRNASSVLCSADDNVDVGNLHENSDLLSEQAKESESDDDDDPLILKGITDPGLIA